MSKQESREDGAEVSGGRSTTWPRLGLVPCSHSAKRPRLESQPATLPARQRHLYLVLDDWESGYSVHRLAVEDFDSDPDAGLDARPAKCPLVRIRAQHAFSCSFAAHGTKILAMHPAACSPGIPAFDTETQEVTVYPCLRSRLVFGACRSVHAVVGDRLVSFVLRHLEVLGPEPPPSTDKPWSWTTVEPPPPFDSSSVSGYALHPDGHTIFMSVENWSPPEEEGRKRKRITKKRNSTFALDTERMEWTHLGDWLLPFKDRAHYGRELDAWVGICLFKEGAGHLCCCDIPPAMGCKTMPAWKSGMDVFFDEGAVTHSGATLVYIGDSSFCLIEYRVPEDYDFNRRLRVLTITSFGLKYEKAGELVARLHRTYASISYETAHKHLALDLDPVAFWM